MNKKQMIIVCDYCDEEFVLNSVRQSNIKLNDIPFRLKYFVCPNCNKVYKASLEDDKFDFLVLDFTKARNRLQKSYGRRNEALTQKLSKLMLRKQEKVKKYVDKLNSQFPGAFALEGENIVYIENGINKREENKNV